jgi:transcriptional regulator with XRE-family HTH domain
MKKRNIIGPRVRQARRSAKPPITQKDLVARLQLLKLSIDQSGISKIEKGQRPVMDFEVVALAKALKIPASWLLGEKEPSLDQANKSEKANARANS